MKNDLPSWLDMNPTTSADTSPTSPTYSQSGEKSRSITAPVYAKTATELSLMELTYENFFEGAIDRIALGHPLKDIIEDDPRQISIVDYLKWVRKDKERKARLKEAEQIAAEILVMQTVGIAEGINSMEDVQRSTLRVNNNWRIAQAYNPEKFGKTAGTQTAPTGGGGITINIGQVESPYEKVEEVEQTHTIDISDVEVRE